MSFVQLSHHRHPSRVPSKHPARGHVQTIKESPAHWGCPSRAAAHQRGNMKPPIIGFVLKRYSEENRMCQHRGAPSSWRKGKIKTSHSVKIPSSILSSIPSSQVSRVHGDVLDQDPPRMRHSVTWEVTCSSDLFFLFCQSMDEKVPQCCFLPE